MRLKFSLTKQAGVAAALLLLSACTGTSPQPNALPANSLAAGQEASDGPAAGPEGTVYAVATDPATITLFESRDHQRRELLSLPAAGSGATEVPVKRSPDQQYIAYIEAFNGRTGTRAVILGSDGQELASHSGPIADLVWASDSQRLILLEPTDGSNPEAAPARLVTLRTNGAETVTELNIPVRRLLGFEPDQPHLYAVRPAETGNPHGEVLIQVQPDTGEVTELIGGPRDGQFRLLVEEDLGTAVAYVRQMNPTYQIRVSRTTGGDTLVLAESESYPGEYAVSPDVSSVAFVNDQGLWVVTGTQRTPVQVLATVDGAWHLKGVEANGATWMFHPQYGYVRMTPGQQLPVLSGQ